MALICGDTLRQTNFLVVSEGAKWRLIASKAEYAGSIPVIGSSFEQGIQPLVLARQLTRYPARTPIPACSTRWPSSGSPIGVGFDLQTDPEDGSAWRHW